MIWVHSRELIGVEQALRRCRQADSPAREVEPRPGKFE